MTVVHEDQGSWSIMESANHLQCYIAHHLIFTEAVTARMIWTRGL